MLLLVILNGRVVNGLHQGLLIPEVSSYILDQMRKQAVAWSNRCVRPVTECVSTSTYAKVTEVKA